MKIEDFIKKGNFTLTSGLKSDVYYNFRKMSLMDQFKIAKWLEVESKGIPIIGIITMGYKIARLTRNQVHYYNSHSDVLSWYPNNCKYIIFDDEITTLGTIRKCILKVGYEPEKILCIYSRIKIQSFFDKI